MDPVTLVLNALASGVARGAAEEADHAEAPYEELRRLVAAKLAGDEKATWAFEEYAVDPETWRAPLGKALTASGAAADMLVLGAAQELMALVDAAGTAQGDYRVDLRGGQGVQIGDDNRQFNTFNSPTYVMSPAAAEIRPGQPRNEAAFGEAFAAAGGRAHLGGALEEVYEDGPGWVQHFDGGTSGRPAVVCALFGRPAVAVDQEVWSAIGQFGRAPSASGTAAVGFPAASADRPLVTADGGPVDLDGGAWGRGRLVPAGSGGWRWEPQIAFDSQACRQQDTWSSRRGEMDLRLRAAAGMLLDAEGLRISQPGREQMLAALPKTGLSEVIVGLARRYGLETTGSAWRETPDGEGHNNNRFAAYQLAVPGAGGRPALLGSLWFALPGGRAVDVSAIADLCVDFDAIRPQTEQTSPATIAPELRIAAGELLGFLTSGWQAAEALVLTTGQAAAEVPPAGPTRLELYIQNRRPENSGGPRVVRTLDMVDLSAFGPPRRTQLSDLSVAVTAPGGLDRQQIQAIVRDALVRMASDFGFSAAETAKFLLLHAPTPDSPPQGQA